MLKLLDGFSSVATWSSVILAIYLTVLLKRKKGFYNDSEKSKKRNK